MLTCHQSDAEEHISVKYVIDYHILLRKTCLKISENIGHFALRYQRVYKLIIGGVLGRAIYCYFWIQIGLAASYIYWFNFSFKLSANKIRSIHVKSRWFDCSL